MREWIKRQSTELLLKMSNKTMIIIKQKRKNTLLLKTYNTLLLQKTQAAQHLSKMKKKAEKNRTDMA